MQIIRFTKVEGAGNDYVLVDELDQRIDDPASLARRVSDRHLGIGSDGVLLVGASRQDAAARMRIFNADGSEGLMCGNGLRCVVQYLVERGRAPVADARGEIDLEVETASGVRRARWLPPGEVEVHMGTPSFLPDALPCDLSGDGISPARHPLPEELEGAADGAYAVSVGNPHLVLRVADVAAFDLARHGATLQASPRLGEGANVHAVEVRDDALFTRPWERGSGATRACGTGAVAVAAVARSLGWIGEADEQELARIEMPGGRLGVRSEADGSAWLSGPARLVYRGEWPLQALRA